MGDFTDQQKLMVLEGDQECSCCGARPLAPGDCDVVDHEVVCIDCVATYHPAVYARRTGESE